MNEADKQALIQAFNIKIGDDINSLSTVYLLEKEFIERRDRLQKPPYGKNKEIPTKLKSTIDSAKEKPSQIAELKEQSDQLQIKINKFLEKTEPLRSELNNRFAVINKLEKVLAYLKSYEEVDDLCGQLKTCNDDEQSVLLYGTLKELCFQYRDGHRGTYVREYTHYWHNLLKDKLTKQYEDILKLLKWPVVMGAENSPLPKDIMVKFHGLTRFLFLIEEPNDEQAKLLSGDFSLVPSANDDICLLSADNPCLPVKILLRPFKKRFTFHFTGARQTARIDRPEWFLTQTLTWIKDHQGFVMTNVQKIADKLNMRHIRTVDEFNAGLISFAAERLHTVLGLYNAQGTKNDKLADIDAAFAHAIDEALGFHRELVTVTGHDVNSVLSVLTKAEIFVRWLAVEKKYSLAKLDETLDSDTWTEPIAGGKGSAVGTVLWVPRGADLFISLLKTIEDRYAVLPQPGHRLQFLELQLELMEEWRVRLTQIMGAALSGLDGDSFLLGGAPHPLPAVVNAAHHTRLVLLQWAHSLHYLQLHYYRRQFQQFTQQQHHDDDADVSKASSTSEDESEEQKRPDTEEVSSVKNDEALSLKDVEQKAKNLALDEVRRTSIAPAGICNFDVISVLKAETQLCVLSTGGYALITRTETVGETLLSALSHTRQTGETEHSLAHCLGTCDQGIRAVSNENESSPMLNPAIADPLSHADSEEAGVFSDAPSLLERLRDAGLSALVDHALLEFRAAMRDYRRQKWHAMLVVEEIALCVSTPLCRPLSALCSRLNNVSAKLAPVLAVKFRNYLAESVDQYIFEEVVLESWFNTGGTMQFTHDVKRNLIPAFAPPNKSASQVNLLPKLLESCKLLNMEYEEARRLRSLLHKHPSDGADSLMAKGVRLISGPEALRILDQRTDLSEASERSVMDLF